MSIKHILQFVLLCGISFPANGQKIIDLGGHWDFQIQRDNSGILPNTYDDEITLPSSMPESLKGDKPNISTKWTGALYDSSYFHNPYMKRYQMEENFKVPFFLTPSRHYVGTAWYRRTVDVKLKRGNRYFIFLERPHITSTIYINKVKVGTQNSLSVPHEYEVTKHLHNGSNTIEICINNEIKSVGVGHDSHSVTDQTQGNWNGIVGRMELIQRPAIYIKHVDAYPDIDTKKVKFVIAMDHGEYIDTVQRLVQMPQNTPLWDEFHPNLCNYTLKVAGDKKTITFGFRQITTQGNRILVNGRETEMRGTVENCNFPNTGYPPCTRQEWERIFKKCKEYGLNHMRFHSYCPPEVAFEVADELGFYLQPEGPSWPNHGVKLGRGEIIDTYLMEETKRMVESYGNHPSFCMMACGNEPSGAWVPWVTNFVNYWKARDPRRIYTGASVGGSWAWQPANQYHVKAGARGLDEWRRRRPESTINFGAGRVDTVSQPFISHETGQWCVFPDLKETDQYTGVNKAYNFDIFRDILNDNGMGDMAEKFLRSSGRLQTLCYKHELERMLRTDSYAGFQLLGLNDYSGQGSAIVGPLNVFFREKGYVNAQEWREFCAPITVMAALPKFTYWNDEVLTGDIVINDHGNGTLQDKTIRAWLDDKEVNIVDGHFNVLLSDIATAQKATLKLMLEGTNQDGKQTVTNHYPIWVYPHNDEVKTESSDIYICKTCPNDEALAHLRAGGTLLLIPGNNVTYGQGIVQQFLPVFWNTSWFKMKPPHTTGVYVEAQHPIFRHFPTEDFSDLQWWSLVNRQPVMLLDRFLKDFHPIVQPIDTWFLSRKLGMLFEANVEGGRVLMSTMPYTDKSDPVQQQMMHAILTYIQSSDFKPTQSVDLSVIMSLYTDKTPEVNMFTNDSPDELKKGIR